MILRALLCAATAAAILIPIEMRADEVTLSSMIDTIKLSLVDAQNSLSDNEMLALSEVEVELNVVNRIEADGRVGFWIIKLGASRTDLVTSNVRMVLTPPPAGSKEEVSPASDLIRSALASAIFEGAAARSRAIGGEPPLLAKEFVITLEFGLTQSGDGEIAVAVPPFDVGAGGGISKSELQRIVLSFGE